MFEIIFSFIFFLTIIYGNGLIINYYLIKKFSYDKNFFFISILGLICSGYYAHIINFFFPLSIELLFINFILIVLFIFIKKKNFFTKIKKNLNIKFFLIVFVLILSIIQIYGSGFSDDLNHYHGSFIGNLDFSNVIIGFNLLHNHFGFSSIWLTLNSYFNFDGIYLQHIHILNSLVLFLVISFLVNEILNCYKEKKYALYNIFISIALIFIILKFTRLKEFGIDRGAVLLFIFGVCFCIKNFNSNNTDVFIISIICLFLSLIKIFYIFTFLIPIFILVKFKKYNFLKSKFFIILLLLIILILLKNLLISGCIIYPFSISCFNLLPWSDPKEAQNLLLAIEASTKNFNKYQGSLTASEFVNNFNWFKTWFIRNQNELKDIVLTTLFSLILIFTFIKKNNNKILSKFDTKKKTIQILLFLLLIFNIIIFIKSPVIRYHQTLFILLAANIAPLLFNSFNLKINNLIIILILCLTFNFGKNIKRIIENKFINDPLFHIKKIGWYHEPKENYLGSFRYFNGWIEAHPSTHHSLSKYKHNKILFFDVIYKE